MGLDNQKPKYTPEKEKSLEKSRRNFADQIKKADDNDRTERPNLKSDFTFSEAIIEKHFREEIAKRGINISDKDMSKIMAVYPHMLRTINSQVERSTEKPGPLTFKHQDLQTWEKTELNAPETKEFLKRFPMDQLHSAYLTAYQKATAEIHHNEAKEKAKEKIDEL